MNKWEDKLRFSQENEAADKRIIQSLFNADKVIKTTLEQDKAGVDFIAVLQDGAKIGIDVKRRKDDAEKYWKYGEPELGLETFSVRENNIKGWTLSKSTNVDYILFIFKTAYCLFPYQQLRMAFEIYGNEWAELYGKKIQENDTWTSEAVFVPVSVVRKAIDDLSMRYFAV